MDADHWPALADAANSKAKTAPAPAPAATPPSVDSPKPAPTENPSPAAVAAPSSAVANPSNSPRHGPGPHHGRHRPGRRGGAGGNGDHSPRDHHDRGNNSGWDHGSGSGGGRGGQRTHHHNNGGAGAGRRGGGNAGGGPSGGVPHHGGFGGRRRGGFEGFYRGPPMGIGPYMRGVPPPPPPIAVAPPYMGPPPPPMRAFAGPMMFHEMPSPVSPVPPLYYVGPPPPPEALRGMAFQPTMVGPPAYPYFQPPAESEPEPEPEPDPEPEAETEDEQTKLMRQIEFYFSKDNLCTDVWFRQQMDAEGWVDIPLIATFKKVRAFNTTLQYIKEAIQSSSMLEMQGDKVRRENDWKKWLIPRADIPSSSAAGPSPNVSNLTAHLGGVSLHESAGPSSKGDESRPEVVPNGSTSSNNQAAVVEDGAGHR